MEFDLDSEVALEEDIEFENKEPSMFSIIYHNDDFTPMEFVVKMLAHHHQKHQSEAELITKQIHDKGIGVAGIYTKDIAETKLMQISKEIKQSEYPLKVSMEIN